MHFLKIVSLITIGVSFMSNIKLVQSDLSDDECGIFEDFETITLATTTLTDKPAEPENNYFRKKVPKKSLLIVFDGTNSMRDDLIQMRNAAKQIINNLYVREDKPIENYVLTVFKDPFVLPTLNTEDPNELFKKLDNISLGNFGNPDCPELAITGLNQSLEYALPNSLAYVFTDAAAKDFALYDIVLPVIQKKQIKVNFIITGDCPGITSTSPELVVYGNLASASEGQVFELMRDNISNLLLTITEALDPKFESLSSFNYNSPGNTITPINVDQGYSTLSVSLSGNNSTLSIKDHKNAEVSTRGFISNNIKIMTFDAADSSYTIEASADSAYSIRIGGISELKFEFGFSTNTPSQQAETSVQPLIGFQNVLTIFISDPSLVKCLTHAFLITADANDSFPDMKILLKRIKRNMFSSDPFDIPNKMFKIKIKGFDSKGNLIERQISTGIESVKGFPPEVKIEYSSLQVNEHGELNLNCKVLTLTPATTIWMFNNKQIAEKASNQSTEVVIGIKEFNHGNVGKYTCKAQNSLGNVSKEVSITIRDAPTVKVFPEKIKLREGETASLNCIIDKTHGDYSILWIDEYDLNGPHIKETYEFTANRHHHHKFVKCELTNEEFKISSKCFVEVEYAPDFQKGTDGDRKRKIQYGSDFKLDCETKENPNATASWFFSAGSSKDKKPLASQAQKLSLHKMNSAMEGTYECVVENSVGKSIRKFTVKVIPKFEPIIESENQIFVRENQKAKMECSCSDCLPVKKDTWNYANKKKRHITTSVVDEINNKFSTILTIEKAETSDEGSYSCSISNQLGKQKHEIALNVQVKPKDLIVTIRGKSRERIDKDVDITAFEDKTLECTAQANPVPTITWYKNGAKVGKKKIILSKTKMNEHDGIYKCVVENKIESISKEFRVNVKIPPVLLAKTEQLLVLSKDEKVSFICDIDGSPKPTITWFFNSKPLISSQTFKFLEKNKRLEFLSALSNYGSYSCSGVNEFGEAKMTFTVYAKVPPSILLPNDETIKKKVGENLDLTCDAIGYPQPNVYWTQDGVHLQNGKHLSVLHLEVENQGDYECVAENGVGDPAKKFFGIAVVSSPSFIFDLSNTTTISDQPVPLTCFAIGHPEPDVYWSYEGKRIQDGTAIEMSSSMKSGFYSCVAENSEGKAEQKFYFNAIVKPTIIKEFDSSLHHKDVREGHELQLQCPFENYDKISWETNGVSLKDQMKNLLRLQLIERSFNGEIKCTATNSAGSSSFSYEINILIPPKVAVMDAKTKTIIFETKHYEKLNFNAGNTLELRCEAEGNPIPQIRWTKSDEFILEGDTMLIDKVSSIDGGIYKCEAKNNEGVAHKIYEIEVSSSPNIIDGVKEVKLDRFVGDSITLRCNIDGSPSPQFSWLKNKELLDMDVKNNLEIKDISAQDAGTYKCIGQNKYGRQFITFTLLVNEPAKVMSVEEEKEDHDSSDNEAVLTCIVKGFPLPKVSWLEGTKILTSTGKINLLNTFARQKKILLIKQGIVASERQVRNSKAPYHSELSQLVGSQKGFLKFVIIIKDRRSFDIKNLKCMAKNDHGPADGKKLEISQPLIIENFLRFVDDRSEIYHTAQWGEMLELKCDIEGSPEPRIQWIFKQRDASKIRDFDISPDDKLLTIHHVNMKHNGDFYCTGSNILKTIQRVFHVTVEMDANWTEFSEWSPCSVSCGAGSQNRHRTCEFQDGTKTSHDKCIGDDTESRICNQPDCVVHGGWSEWGEYSECSRTTGTGYKVKKRNCNNPEPSNGGKNCEGPSELFCYCDLNNKDFEKHCE